MTGMEKEALRYLGYGKAGAPGEVRAMATACIHELMEQITPKCLSLRLPLIRAGDLLHIGGMAICSKDLAGHLSGCDEVWLFAATLGARADYLLERATLVDMSRAVVTQACAAALIEDYCDKETDKLAALSGGLRLRPRYSPGYGDFSLEWQEPLLKALDAPKRIGLSLTQGGMLVPTKSVTAVIGLTDDATTCHIHKCMTCGAVNCPFRKEESP